MKPQPEDLTAYRTWGMPLLQLMGLLALAGIVAEVLMRWILG